jgi:hypothetical protein
MGIRREPRNSETNKNPGRNRGFCVLEEGLDYIAATKSGTWTAA